MRNVKSDPNNGPQSLAPDKQVRHLIEVNDVSQLLSVTRRQGAVLQALSLRCKVGARQFTPKFRHLELVGLQQFPQRPARSTLPCRGGSHGSAQVQCGNILSAWHVLGARLQCDVLRQLLATPRFAVRWPISFGEGLTLETARNSPPRP